MTQLNCEGLIPPFIDYLTSSGKEFDKIIPALDERAINGGVIFHIWWENGNSPHVAVINELDDLRSVRPTGNPYHVAPQSVVDQVVEWDCKYRRGLRASMRDEMLPAELLNGPHREVTLNELDLPSRVINPLIRNGIRTVRQFFEWDEENLLALQMFGPTVLRQLRERLVERGLCSEENGKFVPVFEFGTLNSITQNEYEVLKKFGLATLREGVVELHFYPHQNNEEDEDEHPVVPPSPIQESRGSPDW